MSIESKNIISSTPRQAVIFHPYKFHFGPAVSVYPHETIRVNATSSVLGISFESTKASPSSTFTITLAPDQNWTNRVRPGDWLLIYMSQFGLGVDDSSNPTKGLRCLGNIDRVSKQYVVGLDGKKKMVYKVMGRDFGKIFEKTQFYYNPYIPDFITTNMVIQKSGFNKLTGTPEEFLRTYLNLYYGDGFRVEVDRPKLNKKTGKTETVKKTTRIDELDQMRIPKAIYEIFGVTKKTGKLMDILKVEIGSGNLRPDGYSLFIPPDQAINGNLWEILKRVSNPLINELYTCMKWDPEKNIIRPTIVLRKLPYSERNFTKLFKINLPDNIIVGEDLGFSDHERYNYMNFDPKSPIISNYSQYMALSLAKRKEVFEGRLESVPLFPFIDRTSIQRYGFCSMGNLTTEFCAISEAERKSGSQKNDIQKAEQWMKLLIDWWSNYSRTESGTFTVKGFNENTTVTVGETKAQKPVANASKLSLSTAKDLLKNNLNSTKDKARKPNMVVKSDLFTVGDNVFLQDREKLYHLEGFTMEWMAPGEMNTSFIVTRGVSYKKDAKTFRYLDDLKFESNAFDQKEISVTTTYTRSDKDKGIK